MADREAVVDRLLRLIGADIEDLPALLSMWHEERETFELQPLVVEWPNELGMITQLHAAYTSGAMTEAQQARYRRLVRRIRELLPLMEQLKLERPAEEVLYERSAVE